MGDTGVVGADGRLGGRETGVVEGVGRAGVVRACAPRPGVDAARPRLAGADVEPSAMVKQSLLFGCREQSVLSYLAMLANVFTEIAYQRHSPLSYTESSVSISDLRFVRSPLKLVRAGRPGLPEPRAFVLALAMPSSAIVPIFGPLAQKSCNKAVCMRFSV